MLCTPTKYLSFFIPLKLLSFLFEKYTINKHVCSTLYMARKEKNVSLSLQRCEMRQMEADHQNQLEGISLELMHFESSLRTKENQIDTMLATKDQVHTF